MHILLTNDDGIAAAGITALWQELSKIAKITVVAPDSERSAMSQAITVHSPIRVDQYTFSQPGIDGWRVGGTPADCVKLALETLLIEPPDLVVSGINHGPNLGTDVLYSGTVSAAIEGALHGIPAIAVSLDGRKKFDFMPAAQFVASLVPQILQRQLPPNTLLNVNIPAVPAADFAGTAVTKLGHREYANTFTPRQDPSGRTYYWMGGEVVDNDNDEDTDIMALKRNQVSITPVHFDLTNYTIMKEIAGWGL